MAMRIGRTLPPAAAPLHFTDIMSGVAGLLGGAKTISCITREVREVYRARHCFALSSGKAALLLILLALKELLPGRDEVLIPAYTCYSVPSAIVRAGLRVRLCDMAPDSLDFDFTALEEGMENPRLLCVVSTHLFGLPADTERVRRLAARHGVFAVEDAAQAMGGEWNRRKLGTLGDVGLFSMGRGKAFSTVEGGIIITDNDLIGRGIEKQLSTIDGYGFLACCKLVLYAISLSLLIHPSLYWLPKSMPFLKLGETRFDPTFPVRKLSSFQAGLAAGWKKRIEALRKARLRKVEQLTSSGIVFPGAVTPEIPDFIRFPVMIRDAETKKIILEQSAKMGLGISAGYPASIDEIKALQLPDSCSFPGAKNIAEKIITLPVHPFVGECDLQKMVQLLRYRA